MPTPHETFAKLTGEIDRLMLIATVASGGEQDGCLVGFATQCSIHPPRFLLCLSDKNRTFRVAQTAEVLAVHLVPHGALHLAALFGAETGDEIDKFSRCRWHEGPLGQPILDECHSWFVGLVLDRRPLGDHSGFLLNPVAAQRDGPADHARFSELGHIDAGHPA